MQPAVQAAINALRGQYLSSDVRPGTMLQRFYSGLEVSGGGVLQNGLPIMRCEDDEAAAAALELAKAALKGPISEAATTVVEGLTAYFPELPLFEALRLLCPVRGLWPPYGDKAADLDAVGKYGEEGPSKQWLDTLVARFGLSLITI